MADKAAGGERDQEDDDEQAGIRFLFGGAAEPEPRTALGAIPARTLELVEELRKSLNEWAELQCDAAREGRG